MLEYISNKLVIMTITKRTKHFMRSSHVSVVVVSLLADLTMTLTKLKDILGFNDIAWHWMMILLTCLTVLLLEL